VGPNLAGFPIIKDRYFLETKIAEGGQAAIWKARDTHIPDKMLAVKCYDLNRDGAKVSAGLESAVLAGYRHESIPRLFDQVQVNQYYFIFMDFIDGKTLSELIAEHHQLNSVIVWECIRSLGNVLEYCHNHRQLSIIYGDLKPENVIRTKDGRWSLVDYGSATRVGENCRRMGTPGFAAPELIAGRTVSPATDVYSLAALYRSLFGEKQPEAVHYEAVQRALSDDPGARFPSVRDFLNQLEESRRTAKVSLANQVCGCCGYQFVSALDACPRCQSSVGAKLTVAPRWELSETKTLITPPVNTRLNNALEERRFAEKLKNLSLDSWKALRDMSEQLSQFKGFEKLITVNRLKIQPYQHQTASVLRFLNDFHSSGILADEVGLGKTIEAGIIISELLERGLVRKVLVITPGHLVSQWQEEMYEKIGLKFVPFDSAPQEARCVVVPFYTFRLSSNRNAFLENEYDLIVCDEAHNLVITSGVSTGWDTLNNMKRKYTILITATPIKRKLSDLYYLVNLARPGEFRGFPDFERLYVDPHNPQKAKNVPQLRNILSRLVIRNQRKTCAQNWPKKNNSRKIVPAPAKPKTLVEVSNQHASELVLVFMTGSQAQLDTYHYLRSDPAVSGTRAIFHLAGDRQRKNEIIHSFRKSGNGVLIADKTSSEGRNLQFCNIIVNYDIPPDPIEIEQRIGRVYRIGQTKNVLIYNLASQGDLEEYLLDLYDTHLQLFSLWVGEIYDVIGNLSTNESIPIKSRELWRLHGHNRGEFAAHWRTYVNSIIQMKRQHETTGEQFKDLISTLFG
jgi:serine/threonine protein kinase